MSHRGGTNRSVQTAAAPRVRAAAAWDAALARTALVDSVRKLDPRRMARNPVMFVVEVGSVLTTLAWLRDLVAPAAGAPPASFTGQLAVWLWFTVLFANFAEALAEGRGKAQAAALRGLRQETQARRLVAGREERVFASSLRRGDRVVVEAGEVIPGDGEVIEGIASVDESAVTGESAPVIRESGGDRSAVTGGTRVLSDRIVVRIGVDPGESFLDRMIGLVEGAKRQKTPNEIALHVLLCGMTIIFLIACATLVPFGLYSGTGLSVPVIVALVVCLIPTTIGGLVSAIGIAGMDRLIRQNVIPTSGRAVEAAGDIDTILLDKTGTITLGNRMASELVPAPGVRLEDLADAAQLASLADETPEGRSIVVLVKEKHGLRGRELTHPEARFVPFSAQTRMSGCDLNGRVVRKGAAESVARHVAALGGRMPAEVEQAVATISKSGGTPLVVSDGARVLGVVHLKDVVKGGLRERFLRFRAMGLRTVMITGDNPLTAAAIAAEAGVDDFLAEATPEMKLAADPRGAGEGQAGGDDRRRHERRARAGAGRRGDRHEHRHAGRARGRQHGRPRLEPHQAARGGRGRQAAADDARLPDHVLDRERRGQVLRDPARAVRGGVPADRAPERDAARVAAERDPLGRDLQRADHRRPHPARAARRALPAARRGGAAAALAARLRPGRRRGAVPRDQGDRRAAGRAGAGLRWLRCETS